MLNRWLDETDGHITQNGSWDVCSEKPLRVCTMCNATMRPYPLHSAANERRFDDLAIVLRAKGVAGELATGEFPHCLRFRLRAALPSASAWPLTNTSTRWSHGGSY